MSSWTTSLRSLLPPHVMATAGVVTVLLGVQVVGILYAMRRMDHFKPKWWWKRRNKKRREEGEGENNDANGQYGRKGKDVVMPLPVDGASSIVQSREEWEEIRKALPRRFQLNTVTKKFSTDVDGVSLQTFCQRVGSSVPSLLLVEDTKHGRFGAYCTGNWLKARETQPVGTGESFVFQFSSSPSSPTLSLYPWHRNNRTYQTKSSTFLAIGGGSGGNAIRLDSNLHRGLSTTSDTDRKSVV